MRAQHTPGPWVAASPDSGFVRTHAGAAIASAYGHHGASRIGAPGVAENAHLIAAAPDLLAALDGLLIAMEAPRSRKATEAWDKAHAAIAKARGQA